MNTDGSDKAPGSVPPVRQKPIQSGPIVDKPEDNSNPMDDKQFKDMLTRTLAITDKEKARRGFSLSNNKM